MSIEVICPNGHKLKVKDHWAGQTGSCPKCRAEITVPEVHATVSDEDALAMLGEYKPPPLRHRDPDPIESNDTQESDHDAGALNEDEKQIEMATSGLSLLGSKIAGHKKLCPKCGKSADQWAASCAYCGTYLEKDA